MEVYIVSLIPINKYLVRRARQMFVAVTLTLGNVGTSGNGSKQPDKQDNLRDGLR